MSKDEFEVVDDINPTHRCFPVGYIEKLEEQLSKAEALLNRVIDEVEDPWFQEAYEGFNDGCVFCGSQETTYSPSVGHCRWHKPTCLWFDIHIHVGRTVSNFHKQREQK